MTENGYELTRIFPSLPRTVRGRSINLHHHPKEDILLYCNGNSIFIRNLKNNDVDVYTQHAKDTTCAAYAPSGFYICSGDMFGKIRIWDTTNKEHILKYEYQPMGGSIKDIAWTEDSKRIVVCGEGKEKHVSTLMWDTGTSVGNVTGMTKACNSVDIKQQRPYRLVVGSEDFHAYFAEGPPFKTKHDLLDHGNFVNCARFSPDGAMFATTGADGRCFVYDGKDGTLIGEINAPAKRIHKGGVYGIAWSPDSKHLMTCSADKTVKVWNMDKNYYGSNKEIRCWTMGKDVNDMQVGCDWIGDNLISVSLSGALNFFKLDNELEPTKVVKGHNKAITASCLVPASETHSEALLFTASFDGLICFWNTTSAEAKDVDGTKHSNQVQSMSLCGNMIVTCGMDDKVKFIDIANVPTYKDDVLSMESQPQGVASTKLGLSVVVCLKEIVVLDGTKIMHKKKVNYEPKCVDISPDMTKVAVGSEEAKVHIYDIEGHQLNENPECNFPANGAVTSVKFSPDGLNIACCTNKKQVKVVLTEDYKTEKANWASHAVKVNSIAWTPDSCYLASSGIDGMVITWNVTLSDREHMIKGAHSQSVDVTTVQWLNDNTLLTTGRQDCSVREWKITH